MKNLAKEMRFKLPAELQGGSLNTAKAWASFKEGKIVKAILMCDCPVGEEFSNFRNKSRGLLKEFGELKSGYVLFDEATKTNLFCFLTDGDVTWYN